jgi:hypothetical protein
MMRGFVNAPRTRREPHFRATVVYAAQTASSPKPFGVAIEDLDDGYCSVTNGAELVVREVHQRIKGAAFFPIVYRDSMGRWDQLQHRNGEFIGFAPLGAATMEQALHAAGGWATSASFQNLERR